MDVSRVVFHPLQKTTCHGQALQHGQTLAKGRNLGRVYNCRCGLWVCIYILEFHTHLQNGLTYSGKLGPNKF
jgi:hypothetical protein